ncbi:MAG: helix-turn-helix domain-containing protein, partial [Sphingomicrobium sp.]
MDEESVDNGVPTVGDQLRAARAKKKLSLEDIAARTRIPLRHLESIEASDWAHLPAATYTVGFAKSYAAAVDLDRTEIGDQLRAEMGNPRAVPVAPEVFEPADPARTMPKGLVVGAIIAVLLLVGLMSWFNSRSLSENGEPELNLAAAAPATSPAAPVAAPVAQGPVVLSATAPVWIAVTDRSGASYFSGMLNPGSDFTVPATAPAPLLRTGKPEALKIMVGTALAPPIGPPGQRVSDVSLLPADLLKGGAATPPPSAA